MEKRWCSACGDAFQPRSQVPLQAYCSKPACQRTRKRLWQRTKRRTDGDYRENQSQAQESWRQAHPDYWRQYRQDHPAYTDANRARQKERNARRTTTARPIANVDTSSPSARDAPPTGLYRLVLVSPVATGTPAEWTVQLTWLGATA